MLIHRGFLTVLGLENGTALSDDAKKAVEWICKAKSSVGKLVAKHVKNLQDLQKQLAEESVDEVKEATRAEVLSMLSHISEKEKKDLFSVVPALVAKARMCEPHDLELAGKLASAEDFFLDFLDTELTAAMDSLKHEDAEAAPLCLVTDWGWTRASTRKLQGQYKSATAFVQIYRKVNRKDGPDLAQFCGLSQLLSTLPMPFQEEKRMVEEWAAQLESRYESLQEKTLHGVFQKCKEVDSSIDLILKVAQGEAPPHSLNLSVLHKLETQSMGSSMKTLSQWFEAHGAVNDNMAASHLWKVLLTVRALMKEPMNIRCDSEDGVSTFKVFASLDIDRSGTQKLPTMGVCSWCDVNNELMSPGHCQGGQLGTILLQKMGCLEKDRLLCFFSHCFENICLKVWCADFCRT